MADKESFVTAALAAHFGGDRRHRGAPIMASATHPITRLLELLCAWLPRGKRSDASALDDETAAADIYDECNTCAWFLLPPV